MLGEGVEVADVVGDSPVGEYIFERQVQTGFLERGIESLGAVVWLGNDGPRHLLAEPLQEVGHKEVGCPVMLGVVIRV